VSAIRQGVTGTNANPGPGMGLTASEDDALWLNEPLIAVTLGAKMPSAEFAAVVMVSVTDPPLDTDVGLKTAEAPEGKPETPNVMIPLKLLVPVAVTVYSALPPTMVLAAEGDMPSVKSGAGVDAAFTVSDADALCISTPLVPFALTVNGPAVPLVAVAIDSVVVPEPDIETGLKVPVAPDGKPDAPKLIVPVNPFIGVAVTVYSVPAPFETVWDAGDIASEKSAGGPANNPNAPIVPVQVLLEQPVVAATYTLPLAMVGKTHLFPSPN
jgi:hypothetical protein